MKLWCHTIGWESEKCYPYLSVIWNSTVGVCHQPLPCKYCWTILSTTASLVGCLIWQVEPMASRNSIYRPLFQQTKRMMSCQLDIASCYHPLCHFYYNITALISITTSVWLGIEWVHSWGVQCHAIWEVSWAEIYSKRNNAPGLICTCIASCCKWTVLVMQSLKHFSFGLACPLSGCP